MNMIKCGVIGTGHLGKHHTRILAGLENTDLVGVCDIREDSLRTVSSDYNVESYTDHRKLIGKVEAVVVATPTVTHHEICMDFLNSGAHVLVEKPIAASVEQAEQMVKTAAEKNLILQVGHSERYNPAFMGAENHIGTPRFIETHRLNMFAPRGTDVDVVLDLMIHDLDIVLHFMKQLPDKVDATGVPVLSKEIDIANARLHFPNGSVANITASRVSVNPIRKFRIFQEDTYISIDFKDHNVEIYKRIPPAPDETFPNIRKVNVDISKQEPLKLEISEFINCVRTGNQPVVSGQVGFNALKVALSVLEEIHKDLKI